MAGAEAHTTVRKALGLIGLGRDRVLTLPADGQGRIIPGGLPALAGPAARLPAGRQRQQRRQRPVRPAHRLGQGHGAWVHVDGAFGLWAAASPGTAAQVDGVAEADSWATDAHKWLNTTYDCGIALVRDAAALRGALQAQAAYLPGTAARDPMHYTPQSSQRARGVEVWAVLAALGRDGVAGLVERTCRLARRAAAGLREAGGTVLNDVVLNQVVAAFGGPDRTDAVIAAIQRDGTCWCGPTTWQGHRAMRLSVSCWNTTPDDIDRSVAAIRSCMSAVQVR